MLDEHLAMTSSDVAAASTSLSPPPSPTLPLQSLTPLVSSVRVSSVLHNNSREYGRQHLFDPSPENCWNSEQGSGQWVALTFAQPVDIHSLHCLFQGGFVGQPCHLSVTTTADGKRRRWAELDTRDDNGLQVLTLPSVACQVLSCRLSFPGSSDPFGRVTMYHLDLRGRPSSATAATDSAG